MADKYVGKAKLSKKRKEFFIRFIFRWLILVFSLVIFFFYPESFNVLDGLNFFKSFTPFHILWCIWVFDMLLQIIPIKSKIPLGSQKLFAFRFKPLKEKVNEKLFKKFTTSANKRAFLIFVLWSLLIGCIGLFYYIGFFDKKILFMITALFYIFDLVCVLFWCPFRLILKTKCCTTCRIFNWDHFMMFTPMIFLTGFYSISLVILSCIALVIWEFCVLFFPKRFFEVTNKALQCSECTDKLCTQYCKNKCKF